MDAHLHAQLGDIEIDLRWVLYEDGKNHPRGTRGTLSYPSWRLPILGNILGTKVYTKSKICSTSGEDLFWPLVSLISLMSMHWKCLAAKNIRYAEYVSNGQADYTLCVFPWWELKVTLNQTEYYLKYKPADFNKMLPQRICIWTETKNQERYLREFVTNIKNIPQAVGLIISQNNLQNSRMESVAVVTEEDQELQVVTSHGSTSKAIIVHESRETFLWKLMQHVFESIDKYIFRCMPATPLIAYYAGGYSGAYPPVCYHEGPY